MTQHQILCICLQVGDPEIKFVKCDVLDNQFGREIQNAQTRVCALNQAEIAELLSLFDRAEPTDHALNGASFQILRCEKR